MLGAAACHHKVGALPKGASNFGAHGGRIDKMTMELSIIAQFDELRRCSDVLREGTAEIGKSVGSLLSQ